MLEQMISPNTQTSWQGSNLSCSVWLVLSSGITVISKPVLRMPSSSSVWSSCFGDYLISRVINLNIMILYILTTILIFLITLWLIFSRKRSRTMTLKLVERKQLTHDTLILTFSLPANQRNSGLLVGQHLRVEPVINGVVKSRQYTPISPPGQVGSVALLVKVYRPCEMFPSGGIVSQYLDRMAVGEPLNVSLPYGKLNYEGSGTVSIKQVEGSRTVRRYKNIFMVGGGTGITPLFQIIQQVCENESEDASSPNISLLFANRTPADILLQQELKGYSNTNPKFRCFFSVDTKKEFEWDGLVGFVDEAKVRLSGFEDVENTLFVSCGPPPLCNCVEGILTKNLKVPLQNIFRF